MRLVHLIDSLASGRGQREAVELARYLRWRNGVEIRFVVYNDIEFPGARLREGRHRA